MVPFALAAAAPNERSYTTSLNHDFWRPPLGDVCAAVFHLLQIPPARPSAASIARAVAVAPRRAPYKFNGPTYNKQSAHFVSVRYGPVCASRRRSKPTELHREFKQRVLASFNGRCMCCGVPLATNPIRAPTHSINRTRRRTSTHTHTIHGQRA